MSITFHTGEVLLKLHTVYREVNLAIENQKFTTSNVLEAVFHVTRYSSHSNLFMTNCFQASGYRQIRVFMQAPFTHRVYV